MPDKHETNESTMLHFLMGVTEYLNDLTQANRKLLEALKKYQNMLVEDDTDLIEHATPGLDRIASEIRIIDEKRRAFVNDFFIQRGWNGPRNFSAIADHVSETGVSDNEAAAFERVSQARMELIQVLAEVDAQNSLNLTLIGQGMNFAEVSLKALLGLDNNPTTYGPSDGGEEGPSFLDAQA